MDTFVAILALSGLLVGAIALVVALSPRKTDATAKVRRLELDLVELSDIVDQMARSLKKLHGRAATREAREARHAEPARVDPNDPMARLPGETGEQWKARMGRTLSPIRRN